MKSLVFFTTFTLLSIQLAFSATSIDAVYFAQTHVQKTTDLSFVLVGDRETLIKAHVIDPATPAAPAVVAVLTLGGNTLNLPLTGPATLPASIPDGPGVVQHSYSDSFTAMIPAAWMKPGLSVSVTAGAAQEDFPNLSIGAPTKVIMTMTDVHFFSLRPGDYPAGWNEEIEAKWPVSSLEIRRADDVVFHELVMPPRAGAPAVRVTSREDYESQTGISFDGENSAATTWNVALRRAAGRTVGYSLHYLNKYNVANEGVAGGFSGVGTGDNNSLGILHHELGHALSLPHWGDSPSYPYKGAMHGIQPPNIYAETHAGPTWAFDLRTGEFIPPTVQPGNVGNKPVGVYKNDPMQGGGIGGQDPAYLLTHFSDYSVNQMRSYLENTVVVWNDSLNSYAKWNDTTKDYTTLLTNDGVRYPDQRDQSVISIIASVSGASPDVCMVYPPIGPYTSGLIRLFDPSNSADRAAAAATFSPASGSDVCFRVTQGGVVKTYMLAASYDTSADPLSPSSLFTEGINLPAADGAVTKVELLLTPDAEVNGLPASPQVLYTWSPASTPTPNPASFAIAPNATGSSAITMTATIGNFTDDSNGRIEYYFTEVSGNPGASDSGWQTSPIYTDEGLQALTEYRYTVTMRSAASGAVGSASSEAAATTLVQSALKTVLTARGPDNSWLNDTWSEGPPSGSINVELAPGIGSRNFVATTPWTGTLLLDTGASVDVYSPGEDAISGATHLTMRSAAIYDHFDTDVSFPAMTIEGGSFFQSNNTQAADSDRIFNGTIEGTGGFRVRGNRRMSYIFNQTNTFSGGLDIQANERYVVELNAAQAGGFGNVTVSKRSSDDRSAVLKLGADNVFHPGCVLTLNGKGWAGFIGTTAENPYGYRAEYTVLDLGSYNATVSRLIVAGVELSPGTYTGTATGDDWIDGTGTLTVTGANTYLQWIDDYPSIPALRAPSDDADQDGNENLLEFAFGMDPSIDDAAPLTYAAGGAVTQLGTPILQDFGSSVSPDYHAVFTRRKDFSTAGLTYTVQFSSDLANWTQSVDTPTVLTGAGNPAEVEAVSVPFPLLVPISGGNFEKPTFFRLVIETQ